MCLMMGCGCKKKSQALTLHLSGLFKHKCRFRGCNSEIKPLLYGFRSEIPVIQITKC